MLSFNIVTRLLRDVRDDLAALGLGLARLRDKVARAEAEIEHPEKTTRRSD